MKKRMQTLLPTMLVLVFFLFSGLTGLQAQTIAPSPVATTQSGKVTVEYQQGMDAINSLRTEMETNFDLLNPPLDSDTPANRYTIFRFQYLVSIQDKVGTGAETGDAIIRAYNEVLNLTSEKWPGLVDQTWYDDVVTLLSI